MELSAVISLRDNLSAKMEKASKSVSGMINKVNQARQTIQSISQNQNIQIKASSNITQTVQAAKSSITSLQNTILNKEMLLSAKIDLEDPKGCTEQIKNELNSLQTYLDKNVSKFDEYNNKLEILKQKQSEFTDTTKISTKLSIEQSINSLQNKLAEIEQAKQKFAQWQQISLDYSELENAKSQLSTLESALKTLNSTNVAVRAYIDFKNDALKQIYDIDEKLKSISKKAIQPIINLKDNATQKVKNILNKLKETANTKFSPIVNVVDKTKDILSTIKTKLAKITGTIAYPIVKVKDLTSPVLNKVKTNLNNLKSKLNLPSLKLNAKGVLNTIESLAKKIGSLGIAATNVMSKISSDITKGIGAGMTAASTAVAGIGASSIKTGMQFESSMSQVAATMGMTTNEANYSNKEYALLAKTAKQMGAATKYSASESAEALNYLALAGYDANKACEALPTVLKLAQAGGMDLAATSDMVTDSMSALGIEATSDNLTSFGDKLAKASQKSNTSVSQLGNAILTVGGTAKDLAGGTTELATALGILADNGIKGSEGGTALRNTIESMIPKSDDAAAALKELKVDPYEAGNLRNLNDIFTDFNKATENLTQEKRKVLLGNIFNKTDLKSISALMAATVSNTTQLSNVLSNADIDISSLGVSIDDLVAGFDKTQSKEDFISKTMKDFGLDAQQAGVMYNGLMSVVGGSATRWNELSGYIENSDGAMQSMADTMNDNLEGRVKELSSAWEGLQTAIFEAIGSSNLKDIVKEASGWLTELIKATEDGGINGLVEATGKVFGEVVERMTEYAPLLIETGVNLIQTFIVGLRNNMQKIMQGMTEIGISIVDGFSKILPDLLRLGILIISWILFGITNSLPQLNTIGKTCINEIIKVISELLPTMAKLGLKLITTLSEGIKQNTSGLSQNISSIIDIISKILSDCLPILLNVGIDLISFIGLGIAQNLPLLVNSALEVINFLTNTIMENLPMLLNIALMILLTLTQGIVESLPALIDAAINIITSLGQFITENLPIILDTAIQIIMTLVNGIIENIPNLVDAALQLITSLGQFIIDNLPMLINAGIELVTSLANAIIDNIPLLVDSAVQLILGLGQYILDNLDEIIKAGEDIVSSLAQGIIDVVFKVGEAAVKLVEEIKNKITSTDWLSVGKNILTGIGNGLKEGVLAIGGVIKDVASSIVDKFKNALDIHSPSRLMKKEIGLNIGSGISKGIKESKSLINNEVKNLTDDMIVNFDKGLNIDMKTDRTVHNLIEAKKEVSNNKPINNIVTEANNDKHSLIKLPKVVNNNEVKPIINIEVKTSKDNHNLIDLTEYKKSYNKVENLPNTKNLVGGLKNSKEHITKVNVNQEIQDNHSLINAISEYKKVNTKVENIVKDINSNLTKKTTPTIYNKSKHNVVKIIKDNNKAPIITVDFNKNKADINKSIVKETSKPNNIRKNSYTELNAAKPNNDNNSYYNSNYNTNSSNTKVEKKYYINIDKLFEKVAFNNDQDMNKFIKKFYQYIANDIEDTAKNMGEAI